MEDLLKNEGPGTYIIISCMSSDNRDYLSRSEYKDVDLMRTMHLRPLAATYDDDYKEWSQGRPVITRTTGKSIHDTVKNFRKNATRKRAKRRNEEQQERRREKLLTLRERKGGKNRKKRKSKKRKSKKEKSVVLQ